MSFEYSFPEGLPGIEINEVIEIYGDNPRIYSRTLFRFCDSFKDKGQVLLEAINNNDIETALLLSHTIKGTAAQIGAINLSRAAARAEMACRNNDSDYREKVQIIIQQLDEVLAGIALMNQDDYSPL